MKELNGQASAETPVNLTAVWALLRDVERYPEWAGTIVREAQVLARNADGQPERVHTRLRAQIGPFDREFELMMTVSGVPDTSVTLARLPHEPRDDEAVQMHWTVASGTGAGSQTQITLELRARLDVPRFLPIPAGAGDEVAKRFVQAAAERLSGL